MTTGWAINRVDPNTRPPSHHPSTTIYATTPPASPPLHPLPPPTTTIYATTPPASPPLHPLSPLTTSQPHTTSITTFDLVGHACSTLPYEHTHPIRRLAVSPDGRLLLSVDAHGYLLLVHLLRQIVLCRMRLKKGERVRDLAFSPDGRFFAVTQERQFQVGVCVWMWGGMGGWEGVYTHKQTNEEGLGGCWLGGCLYTQTNSPTKQHKNNPTNTPTNQPTNTPTKTQTIKPNNPTHQPTHQPTTKKQVWRTPGAAREFAPFVLHRSVLDP